MGIAFARNFNRGCASEAEYSKLELITLIFLKA